MFLFFSASDVKIREPTMHEYSTKQANTAREWFFAHNDDEMPTRKGNIRRLGKLILSWF